MLRNISALYKIIPSRAKSAGREMVFKYREATWSKRVLPSFIIIGAQKSGTTSLFDYLSQHPQILPSSSKEVHYFDGGLNPDVDTFKKGESWYRSHFPLERNADNNQIAFEASPLYIFNPLAPQRISKLIPEVKLIAILRNPVERAISHYFHEKRMGREPLPIMEALEKEEDRLNKVIAKQDYKTNEYIHYSYKTRGLYDEQLIRYSNYFSMRNILVINSENLFTQPSYALRRIFEFVGVYEDFKVNDLEPRNIGTNKMKVDPDVYEYLTDYFRPHNQRLYDLIEQRFSW
jgi:hypothetical protein